MSYTASPEDVRLISEISHKLEYALRTLQNPPPGMQQQQGGLDPAVLQSLRALFAPQTLDQLYERVMDAAIAATGAERGFLMLVEDGRKLRYKVGRSINQQVLASEGQTSKTVIKQVIQSGEAVLVGDTTSSNMQASSFSRLKTRTIVCAPLIFGDRAAGTAYVGGVLYVDANALTKTFDDTDLGVFREVSELSSTALQIHSQLAQAGQASPADAKLQQNFERLLAVGQAISGTLVLDDLLELVMEKVLEVTFADRGFLMLLEEGTPDPVFKIGLTWNKKDGDARKKNRIEQQHFMYSKTMTKRAIDEQRSVVLQDAQADGGADASVSIMNMDLHSVMVTPLVEKGQTLGVIYVDSKMSNQSFGDSDVQLFEALAGQAAIGLKNALLYSKVATQQRIESEVRIASEMQQDLCPKVVPQIRDLEVTGYMEPAKEVGGDYYDYVEDPEAPGDVLGMVVGDVSGKGLDAGMVALMARCFLRSMMGAYGMEDPSQLLTYLNITLTAELKPGKFMTMLIMVWDANRHSITWASSGHENIIVWRAATRTAEVFQSGGSPLGISTTMGGPTQNSTLELGPGDTLITYTDGVTEAMDEHDEEYELERLMELVHKVGGQSPEEIKEAILKALEEHRGEREQTDDITMVILRRP